MLVLTRQRNQTIMIGDEVEIKIVDIRGDKVRLGITAPEHIAVHRSEIYTQIREENRKAAQLQPGDISSIPSPFPRSADADASNDLFMKAAVDEAMAGLNEGGLPIGSVLVRGGEIIGRGHNRRVQHDDPMAHAEIDCLSNAGRQKTYRDTVLYSTLMPCHLCSGAAVQFGIPRVVVGESVNFAGAPHFMRSQGINVVDLHDRECIEMMAKFIREHAELWNEDIGK